MQKLKVSLVRRKGVNLTEYYASPSTVSVKRTVYASFYSSRYSLIVDAINNDTSTFSLDPGSISYDLDLESIKEGDLVVIMSIDSSGVLYLGEVASITGAILVTNYFTNLFDTDIPALIYKSPHQDFFDGFMINNWLPEVLLDRNMWLEAKLEPATDYQSNEPMYPFGDGMGDNQTTINLLSMLVKGMKEYSFYLIPTVYITDGLCTIDLKYGRNDIYGTEDSYTDLKRPLRETDAWLRDWYISSDEHAAPINNAYYQYLDTSNDTKTLIHKYFLAWNKIMTMKKDRVAIWDGMDKLPVHEWSIYTDDIEYAYDANGELIVDTPIHKTAGIYSPPDGEVIGSTDYYAHAFKAAQEVLLADSGINDEVSVNVYPNDAINPFTLSLGATYSYQRYSNYGLKYFRLSKIEMNSDDVYFSLGFGSRRSTVYDMLNN